MAGPCTFAGQQELDNSDVLCCSAIILATSDVPLSTQLTTRNLTLLILNAPPFGRLDRQTL